MRTDIADLPPAGPKAPARHASRPASEPRERFTLPPEPDDRPAATPAQAQRPDASAASGNAARKGVAAAALGQASPRKGEEATSPGNAAAAPAAPAMPVMTSALSRVAAQAPLAEAGADAAPADSASVSEQAPDPTGANPQVPPLQGDGAATSSRDARDPSSAETDEAPRAAAPLTATDQAPDAAAMIEAPPEAGDDDASGSVEEAVPVDDPSPSKQVGEEAAVAANAVAARNPAQDKPVDSRVVAEAIRALRISGPAEPASMSAADGAGARADEPAADADSAATSEEGPSPTVSPETRVRVGSEFGEAFARAPATASANATLASALAAPGAGVQEAEQVLGQAASALQAAAQSESPRQAPQIPTLVVPQTAIAAVPMAIGLKALNGVNNFQIRLDPAELGRVDVSLEIDGEGNVNAKLVVDRVETLQLLQRDARTLERAFEQAGLKPSDGGIDLSLRDPGGGERQNGRESFEERRSDTYGRPDEPRGETGAPDPGVPPTSIAQAALRRAMGGVDLRI